MSVTAGAQVPTNRSASLIMALFGLIVLLPIMPGSKLENAYAYLLAICFAVPIVRHFIRVGVGDEILPWFQPMMMVWWGTTLVFVMSLLLSDIDLRTRDYFEYARVLYPFVCFFCGCLVWSQVEHNNRASVLEYSMGVYILFVVICFCLFRGSHVFNQVILHYFSAHGNEVVFQGYLQVRPGLTIGNPNHLGFTIAVAGCAFMAVSKRSSILLACFLLVVLVLLFLTGSRTSLVAFVVGSAVVSFCRRHAKTAVICLVFAVLLFVVADLYEYILSAIDEEMYSRFYHRVYDLSGRVQIWDSYLAQGMYVDNQLFGVGPNTAGGSVYDSDYVLRLYRYGALGLSMFLSFWGVILWRSLRPLRFSADSDRCRVASLSVLAVTLTSMFGLGVATDPKLCAFSVLAMCAGVTGSTLLPERLGAGSSWRGTPTPESGAAANSPARPGVNWTVRPRSEI